jgi:hypothetical protein
MEVVEFAAWAGRSIVILISGTTNKKRFYKQPGILEEFADVLKEKNNSQSSGNYYLN